MKKFFALLISCVLALSAFLLPAAAAGDLEIDFSTLDQAKKGSQTTIHVFSLAGYTDTIIQFGGPENYVSLGEIDLSQYGSVTIEYGADASAVFERWLTASILSARASWKKRPETGRQEAIR